MPTYTPNVDYINSNCPICGNELRMNVWPSSPDLTDFSCNNEKEIVFAKARRVEPPAYHSFRYTIDTRDKLLQIDVMFAVKKNLIVKMSLFPQTNRTMISRRHGHDTMLTLDHVLLPDFPNLTKLKMKLNTYINFS